MIYEHAHLSIDPQESGAFEEAFASVRHELEGAPGCRSVELVRSIDAPQTYLLRVGWDRIEDHLEVFPTTGNARRFAGSVGGYFQGVPLVLHFPG